MNPDTGLNKSVLDGLWVTFWVPDSTGWGLERGEGDGDRASRGGVKSSRTWTVGRCRGEKHLPWGEPGTGVDRSTAADEGDKMGEEDVVLFRLLREAILPQREGGGSEVEVEVGVVIGVVIEVEAEWP